jgi:hypothetical protein
MFFLRRTTNILRCSVRFIVGEERFMDPSISLCRVFHHIVTIIFLDGIVGGMILEKFISLISLFHLLFEFCPAGTVYRDLESRKPWNFQRL